MVEEHIEIDTYSQVVAGRALGARPTQQDAFVCFHDEASDTRLLVLADGMGGDGAGELAAAGVVEAARALWQRGDWRELPGPVFLERLCQEAHEELLRRRADTREGEPHSTVVALLIRGDDACWAHVGDSRLYRFQGLRCLGRTEDHSLAEWKRRHGRGDDVPHADDRQALLRGLGGAQPPQVDHGCATLRPGLRFVLCSDGAWAGLSTAELRRVAHRRDQEAAVRQALQRAVRRGGSGADNATLITVQPRRESWIRRCGVRFWAASFGIAGAHESSRASGLAHRLVPALATATALLLSSCALPGRPHATVTVSVPAAHHRATRSHADDGPVRSLPAIVREDLQKGRYAEGEAALRARLRRNPGDRATQRVLRQLTGDPERILGKRSQLYVVQPGDSYSVLAARFLGDSSLFLALARYNGSDNPSVLQVGRAIRIPAATDRRKAEARLDVEPARPPAADAGAKSATVATGDGAGSSESQARRLQHESLALLDSGRKDEALARLGQALTLDPDLPPENDRDRALRSQLLSSYHERAIVLYRNQRLDPAIALWNRILAIDPGYEPAIVYRTRALELEHRLKQL